MPRAIYPFSNREKNTMCIKAGSYHTELHLASRAIDTPAMPHVIVIVLYLFRMR